MITPSRKHQASATASPYVLPLLTSTAIPRVVCYGPRPIDQASPPASPAARHLTVKQTVAAYPHLFTEASLRNLIWQAEAHARNPKPGARSNGFLAVIRRPGGGRKVLLNNLALVQWLDCGSDGEVRNG
jgi:hypothetical protein